MAKKSTRDPSFSEFLEALGIPPEVYAERALIDLQKASDAKLYWWETYLSFLARQRQSKLDEIILSLQNASISQFRHDRLSRFVSGNHTKSPLSVVGSLKLPGRFNFGQNLPPMRSFPCLYLASDEATARAEKFLNPSQGNGEGNLTAEEMYTKPIGPYLHCTAKVELSGLLDLRDKNSLLEFLNVIATIKIPKIFTTRARRCGIKPMPKMVKTIEVLMAAIFEPKFTQWQTFTDIPSNSQWLGFYAFLAGLQGIIYPSLRNVTGFNIAVFPENLKDTSSFVELNPAIEHVTPDNYRMDRDSYPFFANPSPKDTLH